MNQIELCAVPKTIQFEYRNQQQMHCTVSLVNLVDKIVSFKIKANRPELFLVKPMEGSIYKKQTVKIVFTRKELPNEEFQSYLVNPNKNQEKFMVEIKCVEKDVIGRDKVQTQSALMVVKFGVSGSTSKYRVPALTNKQQQVKKMAEQLEIKEKQFKGLEEKQSKLKQDKAQSKGPIEVMDVILILTVSFLVGFSL